MCRSLASYRRHPNDPVATVKNPELVGSQDAALVLHETQDGVIHYVPTDMGVNGAEGIIHEHDFGIEVDGPRNVESLFLPT